MHLDVEDGEQIEHKMLSSAIEKAQKKIESNNFGIRKNLLEYDQVMNEQREIIYEETTPVFLMERACVIRSIKMITEYVENAVDRHRVIGGRCRRVGYDRIECKSCIRSFRS